MTAPLKHDSKLTLCLFVALGELEDEGLLEWPEELNRVLNRVLPKGVAMYDQIRAEGIWPDDEFVTDFLEGWDCPQTLVSPIAMLVAQKSPTRR